MISCKCGFSGTVDEFARNWSESRGTCKTCMRKHNKKTYERHKARKTKAEGERREDESRTWECPCGFVGTQDEFSRVYTNRGVCKVCHSRSGKQDYETSRWLRIERSYGIDRATYETLLESQGGVCAICGNPERGKKNHLSIDHCHDTGKVRGLLCGRCNSGIGLLNDDPELLRSALSYLRSDS